MPAISLPIFILLNTTILNVALNQGTEVGVPLISFLIFSAVTFFIFKYLKTDPIRTITFISCYLMLTAFQFYFFESFNIKYIAYGMPLIIFFIILYFARNIDLDLYVIISSQSFGILSIFFFWWDSKVVLSLWVVFLVILSIGIYEQITKFKGLNRKEISRKIESINWICNIFCLCYGVLLVKNYI